jgi:hypothetical protein
MSNKPAAICYGDKYRAEKEAAGLVGSERRDDDESRVFESYATRKARRLAERRASEPAPFKRVRPAAVARATRARG